jgi:hypothetical protein
VNRGHDQVSIGLSISKLQKEIETKTKYNISHETFFKYITYSLAKFIPNLHTLLSASLTSPISLPDASPILVPRNKFPTITAPGPGSKTQRMSYITLTNVLCEMKKSRK